MNRFYKNLRWFFSYILVLLPRLAEYAIVRVLGEKALDLDRENEEDEE